MNRASRRAPLLAALLATGLACAGDALAIDEFSLDSEDVVAGKLSRRHYSAATQGRGCDGGNVSPQLSWFGPPPGTESYALVMQDLDAAPGAPRIHWIIVNIPGSVSEIARGAGSDAARLPAGATMLSNHFGERRYAGLCPPPGKRHNYVFRLMALPFERLDVAATSDASEVERLIGRRAINSAAFVVRQAR